MPAPTPKLDVLLARRQLNEFRALRLDLVSYGHRSLIRVGFEGRARGSTHWQRLDTYALLKSADLDWLQKELARASEIAGDLSDR
jgi:hypothetical protein